MKRKEAKTPMRVFLVKAAIVAILVGGGTLMAMNMFKQRFTIMYDPQQERCLPNYSVYLVDKHDRKVIKGKPYAFKAKGIMPYLDHAHEKVEGIKEHYRDGALLLKIVDATEGDKITIKENDLWINGKVHPSGGLILSKTLRTPKTKFVRDIEVQKGEYWVFGRTNNSFDSRYWGPISQDQIVGRAYPIF